MMETHPSGDSVMGRGVLHLHSPVIEDPPMNMLPAMLLSLTLSASLLAGPVTALEDPCRFTYLGGAKSDGCESLALEAGGALLLAGSTESPDFPVTRRIAGQGRSGRKDVFLTRMDRDLKRVIASIRLGGTDNDRARMMTRDRSGHIVIAGTTSSADFPVTTGAYTGSARGEGDVFVVKIDPGLERILAATVIGGSKLEYCQGLAVDAAGHIFVSGMTVSADFPVTEGAADTEYSTGEFIRDFRANIFIARFDGDLSVLEAGTFLGGKGGEVMGHIALDPEGFVLVTGATHSLDFPVTEGAFDRSFEGRKDRFTGDVFVARLAPDLSKVVAATYLGGPGIDWGYAVASDRTGDIYVTGHVGRGFPVTKGAFDTSFNDSGPEHGGGSDAYVARLDSGLTQLKACTFLGGSGEDIGTAVLPDGEGGVLVMGVTRAPGFPVTKGAILAGFHPGNGPYQGDIFLSALTSDLTVLSASTLLGGAGDELGSRGLAVDAAGRVFVGGTTSSPGLKASEAACDPGFNGGRDAFVFRLEPPGREVPAPKPSPRRLTRDGAWDYHPHWSHDGKRISFTSQRGGGFGLWTIPAEGGKARRIPLSVSGDLYNEWFPDDSAIVFDAREGDRHLDLFRYDFATKKTHRITEFDGMDGAPSLSPDGSQVLFVSNRSGNSDLWIRPVEGGKARQVTTYGGNDWHPRWSPKGDEVLFSSDRSGNPDIWILSLKDGAARRLTRHAAADDRASWSPDGKRIAFTSRRSGNNDIWILPAGGGEAVRITNHPGSDSMPCWSPTGDRIAFVSDRTGNLDIWITLVQ